MKNLSISAKMIFIGITVFTGLSALAVNSYVTNVRIQNAEEENRKRDGQKAFINGMIRAHSDIILAAMDSVIDKDEGQIRQERMDIINSGISFFNEKLNDIDEITDTGKEKELAGQIRENFPKLVQGIRTDLVKLIGEGAVRMRQIRNDFIETDNELDKLGDGISENLSVIFSSIRKKQKETPESSDNLNQQTEIIHRIMQAHSTLMLAAMDAIIDKEDGDISQSRMTHIHDSIAVINDHLSQIVTLSETEEEKNAAKQIRDTFPLLADKIQTDLFRLIKESAVEMIRIQKAFAEIDDRLDEYSGVLEKNLVELIASVDTEQEEASEKLASLISKSSMTGLIVFLITLVIVSILFVRITLSITGPISRMIGETGELVRKVRDGELDQRGNAQAYSGIWKELISGINTLIDAFVHPINVTALCIDRIAKGDIPEKISDAWKGDFNRIKNNLNMLIDAMNEITGLAEEMAEGNLTLEVRMRSKEDRLMEALDEMLRKLNMIVSSVKTAAGNVASGSQQLSATSEELSQGVSEQAASAEQASASMEEMSSNISQNSENAGQTERIAVKAAQDARESGKAVEEAVTAMKDIARRISVIEEIARQTDLLALNAAIEAARAGENGKGFAVVASEVRRLAERSRRAAAEISSISSSSTKVAEMAGEKLNRLVPDIQKTADLVQEISASGNEQNSGAEQINKAIQQLDQVIQQNASTSEEMAATSEELAGQSEQLRGIVDFFRIRGGNGAPGGMAEKESWKKKGKTARKAGASAAERSGNNPVSKNISFDADACEEEPDREFVSY
ncbi:MAG: methyl-accepting chemotaxis protein [Desulfococcaceae bacterium]